MNTWKKLASWELVHLQMLRGQMTNENTTSNFLFLKNPHNFKATAVDWWPDDVIGFHVCGPA